MKSICLLLPAVVLTACQSTPPDRFDVADVNKDGKLSRLEISESVDGTIFTGLDADKNGMVSRAEWSPANNSADLAEFARNDGNKDGSVTRDEYMARAWKSPARDASFKTADTDKDGMLNREETQAYYASKEGPPH